MVSVHAPEVDDSIYYYALHTHLFQCVHVFTLRIHIVQELSFSDAVSVTVVQHTSSSVLQHFDCHHCQYAAKHSK